MYAKPCETWRVRTYKEAREGRGLFREMLLHLNRDKHRKSVKRNRREQAES